MEELELIKRLTEIERCLINLMKWSYQNPPYDDYEFSKDYGKRN